MNNALLEGTLKCWMRRFAVKQEELDIAHKKPRVSPFTQHTELEYKKQLSVLMALIKNMRIIKFNAVYYTVQKYLYAFV